MKLSVQSLALTCGLIWAAVILLVGIANAIWPPYGLTFLQMVDAIYPGYHVATGIPNVIVGMLYGLIDGAFGGLIFAWLYNLFAKKLRRESA